MKSNRIVATLSVLGLLLSAGCASSDKVADANAQTPVAQPTATTAPVVNMSDVLTTTGTVRSIDTKGRRITLKDKKGKALTFRVGEDVSNFSQLKLGSRVTLKHTEATILRISRDTTSKTSPVAGNATETLANILAIDAKTRKITFQGPDRQFALKMPADKDLGKVDVGDQVKLTYLEDMVVAIDPAGAGTKATQPAATKSPSTKKAKAAH